MKLYKNFKYVPFGSPSLLSDFNTLFCNSSRAHKASFIVWAPSCGPLRHPKYLLLISATQHSHPWPNLPWTGFASLSPEVCVCPGLCVCTRVHKCVFAKHVSKHSLALPSDIFFCGFLETSQRSRWLHFLCACTHTAFDIFAHLHPKSDYSLLDNSEMKKAYYELGT